MKQYQKVGLVQKIAFDIKPHERMKQYFYFVTRKDAMAIDRLQDYKMKTIKKFHCIYSQYGLYSYIGKWITIRK
ncbi:MAG: hypothetical protein M0P71_18645 [Melioribacteraceae bacterium]|nr:hypothetical protein [Melioribacteraceae bacterium]